MTSSQRDRRNCSTNGESGAPHWADAGRIVRPLRLRERRVHPSGSPRHAAVGTIWRWTVAGVDADVLAERPAPGVWSALEYATHSRDVIGVMGYAAHLARTGDTPVVDPPGATPEPDCPPTIDEAIDGLAANAQRLHAKAVKFDDATWRRSLVIGDDGSTSSGWWPMRCTTRPIT